MTPKSKAVKSFAKRSKHRSDTEPSLEKTCITFRNKSRRLLDVYIPDNTFQPPKENFTVAHDSEWGQNRTDTVLTTVTTDGSGQKRLDTHDGLSISVPLADKAIDANSGGKDDVPLEAGKDSTTRTVRYVLEQRLSSIVDGDGSSRKKSSTGINCNDNSSSRFPAVCVNQDSTVILPISENMNALLLAVSDLSNSAQK